MPLPVARDVTALLHAWAGGDLDAREQLIPLVYDELRRRAAACLRRERPSHTLQPTALVHEAYLKLVDQTHPAWKNRAQFYAVSAEIMRRILVDYARARQAAKRSGRWSRVTLDPVLAEARASAIDVLDLDKALTKLAAFDERKSQIAALRFFAGLTVEETGDVLQLSSKTVEREWQAARGWPFKMLSDDA
jgi:RNA polymerase sigma factor (TIGR02999 family)